MTWPDRLIVWALFTALFFGSYYLMEAVFGD